VQRRRLLVTLILIALVALTFADVRGRMEIGHVDAAQGVATQRLAHFKVALHENQDDIVTQRGDLNSIDVAITQHQSTLGSTNSQTATHDAAILLDGTDVSTLEGCLAGVTQALDQISVGETSGGLWSLSVVGPTCKAATP
jgi:translation elongation factor EF-4